jgi:hypothetical protein
MERYNYYHPIKTTLTMNQKRQINIANAEGKRLQIYLKPIQVQNDGPDELRLMRPQWKRYMERRANNKPFSFRTMTPSPSSFYSLAQR